MGLRVTRTPLNNAVTTYSGGYICSGGKQQPIVVYPRHVKPTKREGFGEVQTPFTFNPKTTTLKKGDLIFCRLAKAGEPLERFNKVYAIEKSKIIDTYPTYRGEGMWLG